MSRTVVDMDLARDIACDTVCGVVCMLDAGTAVRIAHVCKKDYITTAGSCQTLPPHVLLRNLGECVV